MIALLLQGASSSTITIAGGLCLEQLQKDSGEFKACIAANEIITSCRRPILVSLEARPLRAAIMTAISLSIVRPSFQAERRPARKLLCPV